MRPGINLDSVLYRDPGVTMSDVADALESGLDEEYVVRIIKIYLRTPEQKAEFDRRDITIEDCLNGRTEPEHADFKQTTYRFWNAKLGRHHFGPKPPAAPQQVLAGKPKHTPRPWFVDRNHAGEIMGIAPVNGRRHDLDFICTIDSENHGDVEANANLIAAAPDLLDCLTDLVDKIQSTKWDYAITALAREAIAKATGRPQES